MTARLLACPSCTRHIRVDEEHCPFCRVALPGDFGDGPVPVSPPRGLTRAGLFRFNALAAAGTVGGGAALATMLSCCTTTFIQPYGTPPDSGPPIFDAASDVADGGKDDVANDAGGAQLDATPDAPPDVSATSDAGDGG
jgi:hypothetical protein